MRKRRCTDLKTNTRVYLPKQRPATEEAELLTRSQRILEVVTGYIDRECDDKGNQKVNFLTNKQK